jgi:acyl-CoA thioesterase-2
MLASVPVERLDLNLFRGLAPKEGYRSRIFGGHVIAQSLLAAYGTVEGKVCHSLHAYFMRAGDQAHPIIYEVDRARDGGSFATRRVVAVQEGRQIFNMSASFQTPTESYEHQAEMPAAPRWNELEDDVELELRRAGDNAEWRDWISRPRLLEMRTVGGPLDSLAPDTREPHQQVWFRCKEPIGDGAIIQQAMLAYASDMSLLSTALRPHGVNWQTPGFMSASLDHAMWFHAPTDFNEWHLFDHSSPVARGGRGFNWGGIYRGTDGVLVASCAQEGLMRKLIAK